MFDIGFWELVFISIIALLVLGPERLPEFAIHTGRALAKLKRFISNTRRELESELHITEYKNFRQNLSDLDNLMENAPDRENKEQQNHENGESNHSDDPQQK